jgi:hypothetical protein
VVTALLFYFGRLHATGMVSYFGVHFSVLDFSSQDYLVRSADGMIVPLVAVGAFLLCVFWAQRITRAVLPARLRKLVGLVGGPALIAAGFLLVAFSLVDLVTNGGVSPFQEARGIALALGVLASVVGNHILHVKKSAPALAESTRAIELSVAFVLITVGLFWAVGAYASGVGSGRAMEIEAALPDLPKITLLSEKRMALAGAGVEEFSCTEPDALYRYRYEGLRLVLQSGGQYLLLPAGWTRTDGRAALLMRGGPWRIEFAVTDTSANRRC